MERFFNTSGPIDMSRHYGLDPLSRWDLPEVLSLIDQRKYFLMHAPRQTGKTTCLQALANNLNDKGQHACVYMSVERARTCSSDVDRALQAILDELAIQAQVQLGDDWLHQHYREILRLHLGEGALITALRQWCKQNRKPIVLLMDEIDSLADISLVSILQQLRNGYGDRRRIPFPQTVLLCGMRDLRDYNMQVDAHTGATPSVR
ncbi:MAG: ATP-binding protein [Myxococcota bacterium]